MHLEILRLVVDRLRDPVEGVNAKLELLERDLPTDTVPPPIAFIGDQSRDALVAEWQEPPQMPALYVTIDGPLALAGETPAGDFADTLEGAGVALAVRYVDHKASSVARVQAVAYTIRAILRSVRTLLDDGNPVRNGIQLIAAERFDFGPHREALGESAVTGAVRMLFMARDTTANA